MKDTAVGRGRSLLQARVSWPQTLDTVHSAVSHRRDVTHLGCLINPRASFICEGTTFNELFENLGE